MAAPEISESLAALDTTLSSVEQVLDVTTLNAEVAELEVLASVPNLWDDQANAQKVTGRLSFVQSELARVRSLRARLDDLAVMLELAEAEDDADTLAEVGTELASLTTSIGELEVRTLLSGEYDAREALITIRAEAGGVDAADWAEMLLRMYTRYCERHGWSFDVYETSYAEEAGIKSATFAVKAPFAYGTLSVEQGTHRLVRISPFDNQGRRQTSFAGVEVIPVVEQTDSIDIPEDELRIDVYRSSGPGGQGVNTTTQQCVSRTSPAASWCRARTNAVRFRTRPRRWRCCRPNCSSAPASRSRRKSTRSRAKPPDRGVTRCARTCCTPTKWSKICVPRPKPATPLRFSTVKLMSSSSPVSGGVGSNSRSDRH